MVHIVKHFLQGRLIEINKIGAQHFRCIASTFFSASTSYAVGSIEALMTSYSLFCGFA